MVDFRIIGDNVFNYVKKNRLDEQKVLQVTHLTSNELKKLYSGNLIVDLDVLNSIAKLHDSTKDASIFLTGHSILKSEQIHYMKSTSGKDPEEEKISELLDILDEYVNLTEIKEC